MSTVQQVFAPQSPARPGSDRSLPSVVVGVSLSPSLAGSPLGPAAAGPGGAMACRSCVVGFDSLSDCEATPAGSPRPGTSGWGRCGAPGPSFSSRSFTGCWPTGTIPKVTVNPSLLVPLDLKVDPALQQQKTQEKEEMKVLNDKFASLIGKVQALEQRNQLLETRWSFLQGQDPTAFDLGHHYEEYQGRLQEELRAVSQERAQLEANLLQVLQKVEEFRIRYEDEISKRTDLEFTFVQLKKDLDAECLRRTELETKLKGLQSFVELMKTIYEQELKDLAAQVKDVSVTLGVDSRCPIDLSGIVEEVKAQYDAIAARSLEEAEAHSRNQLEERAARSAEFGSSLQSSRCDIACLNVRIQNRAFPDPLRQESLPETGGEHPDSRGAGRAGFPGRQGQAGRAGGRPAAGQAGHGAAAARVPGAHECEAGPGHRDRHLPQAGGGRGEQDGLALGRCDQRSAVPIQSRSLQIPPLRGPLPEEEEEQRPRDPNHRDVREVPLAGVRGLRVGRWSPGAPGSPPHRRRCSRRDSS
uniref:Keratin 80 n=1 Tax=Oryctolagus cuniculus TaxID=9986 RepID=G1U8X9_RABIT